MHTVSLDDVTLEEAHIEGDESARWFASFPFTGGAPGKTETDSGSLSVVYNELRPGTRIGTHRDGTDEALVILDGTVEARAADETETLESDDLALIPAGTPHSVWNVGERTARMVGVFGEGAVESAFEGRVVSGAPD